jgi:hypothetical protein
MRAGEEHHTAFSFLANYTQQAVLKQFLLDFDPLVGTLSCLHKKIGSSPMTLPGVGLWRQLCLAFSGFNV